MHVSQKNESDRAALNQSRQSWHTLPDEVPFTMLSSRTPGWEFHGANHAAGVNRLFHEYSKHGSGKVQAACRSEYPKVDQETGDLELCKSMVTPDTPIAKAKCHRRLCRPFHDGRDGGRSPVEWFHNPDDASKYDVGAWPDTFSFWRPGLVARAFDWVLFDFDGIKHELIPRVGPVPHHEVGPSRSNMLGIRNWILLGTTFNSPRANETINNYASESPPRTPEEYANEHVQDSINATTSTLRSTLIHVLSMPIVQQFVTMVREEIAQGNPRPDFRKLLNEHIPFYIDLYQAMHSHLVAVDPIIANREILHVLCANRREYHYRRSVANFGDSEADMLYQASGVQYPDCLFGCGHFANNNSAYLEQLSRLFRDIH